MRVKTNFFRILTALLSMFLWCLCAAPALADGPVDVGKTCSLTLDYEKAGTELPGVGVKLYRVAEISNNAVFTLTGDFNAYPVIINGLSTTGWENAAETLAGYVTADKLDATETGATNAGGRIVFTGLATGLYLVVSGSVTIDGTVYSTTPFLISLPNINEDGRFTYTVTATPKISSHTPEAEDDTTITVVKRWKDVGYEAARPDSVTVELYRNGKLYSTKTLSAKNNWTYQWTVPDDGSRWQVVEVTVLPGYTTAVALKGMTHTITNTYTPTPPPIDIPDQPVPTDPQPSLPQTGQLWWPVMALAIIGLLLVVCGWRLTRGKESGEQ